MNLQKERKCFPILTNHNDKDLFESMEPEGKNI